MVTTSRSRRPVETARMLFSQSSRGDAVDPDEYYFRTHVRFTTSAPRLDWLNSILAVSTGRRDRDVVTIDVHEVL